MEIPEIERNLTKIKDLDLKLLEQMDDRMLLSFCQTSKYGKELCQNENFWRNRIQYRYPKALKFKSPNKSWKKYYLTIVYYMDKIKKVRYGSGNNERMFLAAEKGEKDLVDFFISEGADDFSEGVKHAAYGGHLDLVKHLISQAEEKGNADEQLDVDDWNQGLIFAHRGNHKNIMDFFRIKGANAILPLFM